jgi:hypothetical protein
MGTISGCRYFKVNLKAKLYVYVNSTIQRCPNKIIKTFLIEDFFHLPPVVNIELRISTRIFEKFETALMVYSGAWGKLIHEKNQKSKISWRCPFKAAILKTRTPPPSHICQLLTKFSNHCCREDTVLSYTGNFICRTG